MKAVLKTIGLILLLVVGFFVVFETILSSTMFKPEYYLVND